MEKRISVIIPIYNAEPFLPKLIKSVEAQTCPDLEVLLVDDGSTDGSGEYIDRVAAADPRFRAFHKPNGGSSSARNVGLEAATGEYIGFVDADDHIEPDMYASLQLVLNAHPEVTAAQILSCEEDEDGNLIHGALWEGKEIRIQSAEEYFTDLMLHTGDSSFCTKLFRADFIKNYRFTEGRLNEDFELLLRMTEKMKGVLTVPKLGYHIVLSRESNTRGTYNQAFYEVSLQNAELARQYGEKFFPGHEQEITHFYLVQAMWFLLHIPTEKMNRSNELYVQTMRRLHSLKGEIRRSPYLNPAYRRNLILLTHFPARAVRRAHGCLMKMRRGQ